MHDICSCDTTVQFNIQQMKPRLLITAGCSFSTVPYRDTETWPVHLHNHFNCKVLHTGQGATGNISIARKVLYNVHRALKTFKADDILVGIMWSGPDRHEIISENPLPITYKGNDYYAMNIPYSLIDPTMYAEKHERIHYVLNQHWNDEASVMWYKNFHDPLGAQIETLEQMLRVQWYLKLNTVKYFMTSYAPHTLDYEYYKHPEAAYLYTQLDQTCFLPTQSALQYMLEQGNYKHDKRIDGHPTTNQHKDFTENVIIPYLKNRGYE